jgi:hypothetical protein
MPGDVVEIVVERETPPADCSVSFEGSTANVGFTQEELNELSQKQEKLDLIRVAIGAVHEVLSLDLITQDGVVGVLFILKPKMDVIAHMRNYQAVFELPRGRTAILCMANQDEFDKLRKDYQNITKGVKFPH